MGFHFEPIAAFNSLEVAKDYAQRCADVPRSFELQYKVTYGQQTIKIVKSKEPYPHA
jgi:hypothetical protein